jgi:mannose-6-phosphate isomerase
MASSDNVMRGGLTQKHVDVEELCHILEFTPFLPHVLSGQLEPLGEGVRACIYGTPAQEFELTRVQLALPGKYERLGPALLLVESGRLELSEGAQVLTLSAGRTAFVSEGCTVELSGDGAVAIAALPLSQTQVLLDSE